MKKEIYESPNMVGMELIDVLTTSPGLGVGNEWEQTPTPFPTSQEW